MTLKKELEKDLLAAMKSKDETRKNVLRMAISSIKLAEVESGSELEDTAIFGIMQKEIKICTFLASQNVVFLMFCMNILILYIDYNYQLFYTLVS